MTREIMNSSNTGLRRGLQISAVGAATAVAVGFLSAGAANADTFVPLPDGSITEILADGTVVTITRTGESANISRRRKWSKVSLVNFRAMRSIRRQ